MLQEKNDSVRAFDPGRVIFSWVAHNYHPHQRGIVWMVVFCTVLFGGALWAWVSDPKWGWITSLSFLVAAGVYFWTHRNGDEYHEVVLTEKGVFIDGGSFQAWEKFRGYWFVYDESVAVINFQFADKPQKISLQMGEVGPEKFREIFEKAEFPELTGMKESLTDLWVRALKL